MIYDKMLTRRRKLHAGGVFFTRRSINETKTGYDDCFFSLHSVSIKDITIKDTPVWQFGSVMEDVLVDGITILNNLLIRTVMNSLDGLGNVGMPLRYRAGMTVSLLPVLQRGR